MVIGHVGLAVTQHHLALVGSLAARVVSGSGVVLWVLARVAAWSGAQN